MKSTAFIQLGLHKATDTPLYVADLNDFEALKNLDFPARPLTLFVAADTRKISVDEIGQLAEMVLKQGLRYLCAWGPDCKRVHDIFDEIYIGPGDNPYNFDLMTTWHDDESLGEALWFFLNCAHVGDEMPGRASFAVRIGNPPESAPIAEVVQRIDEFAD
jgi:hypothetical protein